MRVQRKIFSRLLAAVLFLVTAFNLLAQGTAIFYQGRLNDGGAPANSNYDFRFAVFTAPTNGTLVSPWLTNTVVPVSNGLFGVKLDFGAGVFNGTSNGSNYWLDIGVRAIGVTNFTPLVPRQPILPVPYAIFATSASNLLGSLQATQLTGTVPASQISGTYSNGVNFSNGTNSFTGNFSGNGINLTNLNASNLATGTVADTRLSANVDLLGANQTFSGTKTFSAPATFNGANIFNAGNTFNGANTFAANNTFNGVNTFTNNGNSFQGSFFGNGLVGWLAVGGTTTNATRDTGYLLLNAGLTSVTLPGTASLFVGDIVRVSGGGSGGWLVKQNSGQSITGTFATYANSTLSTLGTANDADAAASADGVQIYVVGGGIAGVSVSSDSGHSWNSAGTLSGGYNSLACSDNGKIVYAQPTSGNIWKSTDGGATWSDTGTPTTGSAIACTADGGTLLTGNNVACSGNGTYRARLNGGVIQYSNNGGTGWNNVSAPVAGITCLAVSSDCTRIVAGVSNGLLYATSNLGTSWTTIASTSRAWSGLWMSPDGSKFAATAAGTSGVTGIFFCNVSALPNTSTTTGSAGTLGGSLGSAVELQFIGGGLFKPVSSTGLLWAN